MDYPWTSADIHGLYPWIYIIYKHIYISYYFFTSSLIFKFRSLYYYFFDSLILKFVRFHFVFSVSFSIYTSRPLPYKTSTFTYCIYWRRPLPYKNSTFTSCIDWCRRIPHRLLRICCFGRFVVLLIRFKA